MLRIKRTMWLPVVLIVALALGALPTGAQSGETLSEAYGTPGNGFSFNYPARWIIESQLEGEDVTLVSNRAALEAALESEAIPRGELFMVFMGSMAVSDYTQDDISDLSLEVVMKLAAETLSERREDGFQMGQMEATQVAGHPAIMSTYSSDLNEGVAFTIDFAGTYVWVKAKAALGTFSDHETLVWSILDTLDYTTMVYGTPGLEDLTEDFTSPETSIRISYPAAWSTFGPYYGMVWLTNDPMGLDEYLADELSMSPVSLRVYPPEISESLAPGVSEAPLAEAAAMVAEELDFDVLWTEATTLAGRPGLIAHVGGGFLGFIDVPEGYVMVFAKDGWGLYEAQMLAMVDTLDYTPTAGPPEIGALTESYLSPDGTLSIAYPSDWVMREFQPGVFTFSNDPVALDAFLTEDAAPPEVLIYLIDPIETAEGFRGMAGAALPQQALEISVDAFGMGDVDASEAATIAGQPAMIAPWEAGSVGVIQVDSGYFVFMTVDGWGAYQPHIMAILDTLTYTPIAIGVAPSPPELIFTAQHKAEVYGAAWNADETLLLTRSADGAARIWDLTTQESIFTAPYRLWGTGPAWNADETRLVVQTGETTIDVWDLTTQELLFTAQHEGLVHGGVWNADETRLLTWSDDGAVIIWDAATGDVVFTAQLDNRVRGAAWNADETLLLTWSFYGGDVQVWDLSTGEEILTVHTYAEEVTWNGDGTRCLVRSSRIVEVWDVTTGEQLVTVQHDDNVSGVVWNADETRLLTWLLVGHAQIWDATTGELLFTAQLENGVWHAKWNRDETWLLTRSGDYSARIWDTATGELLFTAQHEGEVRGAVWNADETLLLTWSEDTVVRVWDLSTGEALFTAQHEDYVTGAAWNADETQVLTQSWDGTACIWDAATGELLFTAQHEDRVFGAKWNADETLLVTWSADGTARIWDVE